MLIMCHVSSVKGHVICSQHKAWNDTIRMAMYIEQIMKPLHDKNGGKNLRGSIDSSLFDMDTNPYIHNAIVELAIDSYLDDNVDSEDENEQ